MAEEIAFENGQISNFEGLVTLTLDRVILHTVVHHSSSSTSTYMSHFIEIEETFCGRTDGQTDGHLRPALLGRLLKRRPKNQLAQRSAVSLVREGNCEL